MRTIIFLAFGLIWVGTVQAQVGSSISSDGTPPNTNAMLDVQSPATGDGKGILIPRVTLAQRTTATVSLAGGLLDNSGNLRGGGAQGLIVYQTDGVQGLYFNTSQTAAPTWSYLGDIAGLLASNVWAAAGSTTNYLPRTGGTMSGALNMGGQIVSNVVHIDFNGTNVSVGREANGSDNGTTVGYQTIGTNSGVAVGYSANGSVTGVAVGASANGYNNSVAVGYAATGSVAGVAVGREANGVSSGTAVGREANGYWGGVAVGREANGNDYGVAMGYRAVGVNSATAIGSYANGYNGGSAMGYGANGANSGAAVGYDANGCDNGTAMGRSAQGYYSGVAMGYDAAGANTNVAIGAYATTLGGSKRIAIGYSVTNEVNNSAVIRGTLYLDGGTGVVARTNFGSGTWFAKAFEIDHPLDPENKVLRHFCLEGPVVQNVYNGSVQLDAGGEAIVELPAYFEALNADPQYFLTAVGTSMSGLYVKQEMKDNRFVIGGGVQGGKVCWEVKARRNDPGCLEDLRRRPVEQFKRDISN